MTKPSRSLNDAELMELGGNLRHGVPIANAGVDGARKPTSSSARIAGMDKSGQSTVYDGRTGDAFDRKVTVGLHLHAQAAPSGGRQDPRAFDRPVLARHPAAAGRQRRSSADSVSANGSVGARGLRRGVHPAGNC